MTVQLRSRDCKITEVRASLRMLLVPAFTGGGLSLAAALGLLRRPARQFFAGLGPAAGPAPGGDGGTAFTAAADTVRRNVVLRPA